MFTSVKQRLPDAIIIGTKKSGTSFLSSVAQLHSRLAMRLPEIHFFDTPNQTDPELYRTMMKSSFQDQVTMDKTPKYWITQSAPNAIKEINPKIKLILILRDPACRLCSDFHHEKRVSKITEESFEDFALDLKNEDIMDFIVEPSRYDVHMKNWLRSFPLSQFYIIRGEDMYNPKTLSPILRGLEEFLGIPYEFMVLQKGDINCVTTPWQAGFGENSSSICWPSKNSGELCQYDRQYSIILDVYRRLLNTHVQEFERITQQNFYWPNGEYSEEVSNLARFNDR